MLINKSLWPSQETTEDVLERIERMWDFSEGLPQAIWTVKCPFCLGFDVQYRQWTFHERKHSSSRFRCDVSFKCRECSGVWVHGIVVPEELFHRMTDNHSQRYTYQEAYSLVALAEGKGVGVSNG